MARRLGATFGKAYRARHPLTIDEKIARMAARLGVSLLPWQKQILRGLLEMPLPKVEVIATDHSIGLRSGTVYYLPRVVEPRAFIRVTGAGL